MKTVLMLVTVCLMGKSAWAATDPDGRICEEDETAFYWMCASKGGVTSLDECRNAGGRDWSVSGFYPCPDNVRSEKAATMLTYNCKQGIWRTECVEAWQCRQEGAKGVTADQLESVSADWQPSCSRDSDVLTYCTVAYQLKACGINDCDSDPCNNGGRCFSKGADMGYECYCYGTGYTGDTCDEEIPE